MPNILFRADAEESIGTGDLLSLIYLSREFLKRSWGCFFAIRDYPLALRIIAKHKLRNTFLIPHRASIKQEIKLIGKIIKEKSIDCLCLEITKTSLLEYVSLGKPVPVKACINFDGEITDDFEVVINWGINSSDQLYAAYRDRVTKFILGFQNAILPDYFDWEKIARRKYKDNIDRILITMGGVDEFNLTKKIVEFLRGELKGREILIITGAGYRFRDDLSKFMKHNFKYYKIKDNVYSLFNDYLWSDLAFSAGGLTSSELVAARTPALFIAAYEHQIRRCEYFAKNKWAYYLGYRTNINEESIRGGLKSAIESVDILRNKLSAADFQGGSEKIFETINSYFQ